MSFRRTWKLDLGAVVTVAAMLMSATPVFAEETESFSSTSITRALNLQAPDPATEPPKVDAPKLDTPPPAPAERDTSQPLHKTSRFWMFVGVTVVGAVALVWGGSQLFHEMRGGDPKPCANMAVACAGEGR